MGRIKNLLIEMEDNFIEEVQELGKSIQNYHEWLSAAYQVVPVELKSFYEDGELEVIVSEMHNNRYDNG